jgi:hypothetical protein
MRIPLAAGEHLVSSRAQQFFHFPKCGGSSRDKTEKIDI